MPAQSPPSLPPMPAAERQKLRTLLLGALAEPGAKASKDLLAAAKAWETKFALASLVDALREGPALPSGGPKPRGKGKAKETFAEFGTTIAGFTFASGGATYRYLVDVPKGYDPKRPVGLLVDPGHGTGAGKSDEEKAGFVPFFRTQAANAGLDDLLVARTEIVEHIGAGGLAGEKPEDEVAGVFRDFFRDVQSRFAIDLDRVFVAGLSQTGYWSWYLGQSRPDRYAGIAPMSAVTWQSTRCVPNFTNLPVAILHGDSDPTCPVAQARGMKEAFEQRSFKLHYDEVAGAGHDVKVWSRLGKALEWLAQQPRQRYPKQVARNLQTLAEPWCYWIRVDALAKTGSGKASEAPTAELEANVDGQTIAIRSEGVDRLTVALAPELLDVAREIEIVWNDRRAWKGKPAPRFATAVDCALERGDWLAVFVATVELGK